jgi:hypothetical protein
MAFANDPLVIAAMSILHPRSLALVLVLSMK